MKWKQLLIVVTSGLAILILAVSVYIFTHSPNRNGSSYVIPYVNRPISTLGCMPGKAEYSISYDRSAPVSRVYQVCMTAQEYKNYQASDPCKNHICPICLSTGTMIDTPDGRIAVTKIHVGSNVWSQGSNGSRVAVRVIKTTRRQVPKGINLLHVVLSDGRQLLVSPSHPTATGQLFKDVAVGQTLDRSIVRNVITTKYDDGYTYDLLPDTATGYYWANGVLVGSTLR